MGAFDLYGNITTFEQRRYGYYLQVFIVQGQGSVAALASAFEFESGACSCGSQAAHVMLGKVRIVYS